jgi:hypothetical protein
MNLRISYTTLGGCERWNPRGTCGTIALLDEGGESMRSLVKEKSSMVVHLMMI